MNELMKACLAGKSERCSWGHTLRTLTQCLHGSRGHLRNTACALRQALSGPVGHSSARGAASMSVRQHALEAHVPALQGPFPLESAEGKAENLLSFAQSEDTAVDLCTLRCAQQLKTRFHRAVLCNALLLAKC